MRSADRDPPTATASDGIVGDPVPEPASASAEPPSTRLSRDAHEKDSSVTGSKIMQSDGRVGYLFDGLVWCGMCRRRTVPYQWRDTPCYRCPDCGRRFDAEHTDVEAWQKLSRSVPEACAVPGVDRRAVAAVALTKVWVGPYPWGVRIVRRRNRLATAASGQQRAAQRRETLEVRT
jgi:hypothetical protein